MLRYYFVPFLIFFGLSSSAQTVHWVTNKTDNNSVGSFRSKVGIAQPEDTIKFHPNLLIGSDDTVRLTQGAIVINKSLYIKGVSNGVDTIVISGEKNRRVLNASNLLPSDTLVLDELIIAKGFAPNGIGGGIYQSKGTLFIKNCGVKKNEAFQDRFPGKTFGGGLYSDSAAVIIENSFFTGNHANVSTNYGTNCRAYGGGAYFLHCDVSVKNTIFNSNRATADADNGYGEAFGGGVYSESSAIHFERGLFRYNEVYSKTYTYNSDDAYAYGGGTYLTTSPAIFDSTNFLGNKSEALALDQYNSSHTRGGGVYGDSTIVFNQCRLSNQKLVSKNPVYGGGIFSIGHLDFNGGLLDSNVIMVSNGGNAYGGAVYAGATFNISDATVENNICKTNKIGKTFGGGIYALGAVVLNRCEIKRNRAITFQTGSSYSLHNNASGGGIYGKTKISLAHSLVDSNYAISSANGEATSFGGGLFCEQQLIIDSSEVINNTAYAHSNSTSRSFGGALYGKSIDVKNSEINHNWSKTTSTYLSYSYGGGISCPFYSSIHIENSEVNGNKSENLGTGYAHGGGIYVDRYSSLSTENVEITNNNCYADFVILFPTNASGGGVYADYSSPINLFKTEISANQVEVVRKTSSASGGGIFSNHTVHLEDCSIAHNRVISDSTAYGGGVHVDIYNNRTVNLKNTSILNNEVDARLNAYGGGVYCFNLNSTNSTIAFNSVKSSSASAFGGGFFGATDAWNTAGAMNIINNTIAYNTLQGNSSSTGSGVWNKVHALTIKGSIVGLNQPGVNLHSNNTLASSAFNIFQGAPAGYGASDSINISQSLLKLDTSLQYNGGYGRTLLPLPGSIAIDNGDPSDLSDAQNKPILGTRDIGSTEVSCKTYLHIDVETCGSYTWGLTNTTYTQSGTYTDTLLNSASCDSIVTLNLTLNYPKTGQFYIHTCAPAYTWIDGIKYTQSNNTATHTLVSSKGCDSVVTLNLVMGGVNAGIDTVVACGSYQWINGQTYIFSTNVPQFTLTNSSGCDSVVTLNLTINRNKSGVDVINKCGHSYTWIDGVTYTQNETNASFLLSSHQGCDSLVTLNLSLTKVDTGVSRNGTSLQANTNHGQFVWLNCDSGMTPVVGAILKNFHPPANGRYALEVTQDGCIDTSACHLVNTINIKEQAETNNPVVVFPNPTTGTITILLNNYIIEGQMVIRNTSGQVIEVRDFSGVSEINIDIKGSAGLYLIELKGADGQSANLLVAKTD
jgi:hypothetical protein